MARPAATAGSGCCSSSQRTRRWPHCVTSPPVRAPGTDASEFAEAIKDTVLTELLGINPGNALGLAHFRDSATESE